MMSWQGPQKNNAGEIDDHDLPTEPIPRNSMSSFPIAALSGMSSLYQGKLPTPQPLEQPFPRQYVPWTPRGTISVVDQPVKGNKSVYASRPRRSPIPALVGLFFVVAQLLLLVHFALHMLVRFAPQIVSWSDEELWVKIIDACSAILIWPVYALLQEISLPITIDLEEIYILLAILLYGLLARILVRILKAIFHK